MELDGWSWMGGRVDGWVEVRAHPSPALDQARLTCCTAVESAPRLATLGREGGHTRAARAAGMQCMCMCGIAMCVYILSAHSTHSTHSTDVTHSTPTPTPNQAAVKQEELAACLTLLQQQQQQQQQQQGQAGDASLHATGSNAQPAAPASSNPNLIPSPNTVPNPDPDPNPNPKQAAPASSWLSTSSSFPRNVLRRVSDALGGSERDLGVN